ncbi:response regulator transcription factor [Clostridium frigidicarnis]|uniref:Stage 0 sporulation protein A homolog n=1 Tax=Clostridium frigidicarnis TaxID=84698 RepID=A0A1I0ZL87_9CLOT|nr:helix-turn-helix domain-containing protein [Clostridium frigidicarnis]SFB25856.1 Helix-turn-helix domain-containing protein [Clostridium frigidicarnis]
MCKVIIADDEELELEALKMIIDKKIKNVSVVGVAHNGDEVIKMNDTLNPDIIFMDAIMPGIDGFEAAKIIKKQDKDKKIILMSIYDNFEFLQRALKIKVDDYLLKPIKPEKVIEILDEYIKSNEEYFLRKDLSNEDKLKHAVRYIEKNFKNNITLKDVADYMNFSNTYFSKSFKKYVGVNFNKYITEIRIKEAKRLLEKTSISINDLAFDMGYNEPNYFCKVFKKMEGITPSEYREKFGIKV